MPRPLNSLGAHARGAFRGALAASHGAGDGSEAAVTLLRVLAEELAAGRTDLRLLAQRWVERNQLSPGRIDAETADALKYLALHHAPPERASGRGSGPLARVLPVALAAFDSPRNLVSATYHIAALTHPDPHVAWAAVAVNVALARFVNGKRDFIPDVIEALRGNAAPEALLAAVRRVPVGRREGLPARATAETDAVAAAEIALWLAYHEPLPERGLDWLAGNGPGVALAIAAGALLGARDGGDAVPSDRLPYDLAMWDVLAERLVRIAAPDSHFMSLGTACS